MTQPPDSDDTSQKKKDIGEREFNLKLYKIERYTKLAALSIRGIVFFGLAWCIKEALVAHAGEETLVTYVANLQFSEVVGEVAKWVTMIVLAMWGYAERKSRKGYIERNQSRVRELEERLDPSRTSSELTPRGELPESETL